MTNGQPNPSHPPAAATTTTTTTVNQPRATKNHHKINFSATRVKFQSFKTKKLKRKKNPDPARLHHL
jgi:hypothetical protein